MLRGVFLAIAKAATPAVLQGRRERYKDAADSGADGGGSGSGASQKSRRDTAAAYGP